MLLGEYEHAIDEKGRITIPAKFRGELAEGIVVTKGIDRCLWLFPMEVWVELSEVKFKGLRMTDPNAREFQRQVFGAAFDSLPDKQSRFILPPLLREYANIDKQAVIIGLYDRCEIWNPDLWRERRERSDNDPEGRARQFESLGI
jgi:MraZ protein